MNSQEREAAIDLLIEDLSRLPAIYKHSLTGLCQALQIDDPNPGSILSMARIKALVLLSKRGRATVGEMAHGLDVSIATASQILDRMVDDGWVARETNPADRRQVLVWLLPHAQELAQQLRVARRRQVEAAFDAIPEQDRAQTARVVRLLTDALRATAPTARPERPAASD